jgi:AbrB family looped-hinge helix DNA binding protein
VRVTEKGQVTIPQAIRESLGIRPGSEVAFTLEGDHARLERVRQPYAYPSVEIVGV